MAVITTYSIEDVRDEFRASTVTAGDQHLSNVIGLANGGYAVVYASDFNGAEAVAVDIYDSPTDTAPVAYTVGHDGRLSEPTIARLTNGDIAIGWHTDATRWTYFKINATTATFAGSGYFILGTFTDPEIFAIPGNDFRAVAKSGNNLIVHMGGFSVVSIDNFGSDPAATALSGGATSDRFAVAYVDGNNEIRVQVRTLAGSGVGNTAIATSAGGSAPQVAALKDGGFAVVFRDATINGGAQTGIGLVIFNEDGVATSSVIRLDNLTDAPANEDFDPEVAILDNGYILVTWTYESDNLLPDRDVYARVFKPDGTPIGAGNLGDPIFKIASFGANETQSSIAALLNGQFVTTWTDTAADGDSSGTGISGRVQELVRTQTGDDTNNVLTGDALRDIMHGGAFGDVLDGGGGRDELHGNGGDDVFTIRRSDIVADEVYDGGGNGLGGDQLDVRTAGGPVIDLRGVMITGMETLNIAGQNPGDGEAIVRMTAAQMQQFQLVDWNGSNGQAVEVSMGTSVTLNLAALRFDFPKNNTFIRIYGDSSAETITGSSIGDTIDSGAGNDTLNGWLGRDTLRGGLGNDSYVLGSEASGTDAVQDGGGIDTITSTISRRLDFFDFSEIENLTLLGRANIAGTGNRLANTIIGNSGRNTLDGGIGNDRLDGGIGNDVLIGGVGRDTLTGGIGNDIFKFTNKTHSRGSTMDIITDFDDRGRGNDRIDVSALFGPRMKYIHDDAFTASGQVRIKDIAGPDVIVEVNTGGSLAADFSIRLKGTTLAEMSAGDFVL